MPTYHYQARQGPGQIVNGEIDAPGEREAVARMLRRGLTPLRVILPGAAPAETRPAARSRLRPWSGFGQANRRLLLIQQLSDLCEAHVPPDEALGLCARQAADPQWRGALNEITAMVRDGSRLSAAAARFPKLFPAPAAALIHAGETGGFLPLALRRLAEEWDAEARLRAQISAALFYPALIATVGAAVVVILLVAVIPKISVIFLDLDVALPLPTRVLLALSDAARRFGGWALAAGIAAVLAARGRLATDEGRRQRDRWLLRLPVWGPLVRSGGQTRFSRTMATLLESGVPVIEALDTAAGTVNNTALRGSLRRVSREVAGGASLAASLRGAKVLNEDAVSMIAVNERAGRLAGGFRKAAEYGQRRLTRMTGVITSALEPVMILVIGALVGFTVMALLMPIFRMNVLVQ